MDDGVGGWVGGGDLEYEKQKLNERVTAVEVYVSTDVKIFFLESGIWMK